MAVKMSFGVHPEKPAQPVSIVWIATIEHKHGVNKYVHQTEDTCRAALAEYCRHEWYADGPGADDDSLSPPTNNVDCIDEYFADNGTECYSLTSEPVLL